MSDRPDWTRDGRDWPNREASRFVQAAGFRWHVQVAGAGPAVLLAHGTGAATHSWRGLLPLLARAGLTAVAPDLPGHGFTGSPGARALSLPGMAGALAELLRALRVAPEIAVGHSAGAAVLARMALDGAITPRGLVGVNAALLPFREAQGRVFSSLARFLVGLPAVPWLVAWRAGDRTAVERLLHGTGSRLDPPGLDFYARLLRRPSHVGAALGMMANWQLEPLLRDLPRLKPPPLLVVGAEDRTVRPADSETVRRIVPGTRLVSLPGLGHLAHEERPDLVLAAMADLLPVRAPAAG